jgi:peptidyl-prolyl cis-trans isomerase C
MKKIVFVCLMAASAFAQVIPTADIFPDIPADEVLAVFDDGVKFTMGQFRALYLILPPQNQQGVMQNRKAFVEQLALFRKLSAMAEKDGLDKQTPTKEAIEYQRMVFLSQAKITASMNMMIIEGDDLTKAYEANKERFKQVKVKAIYVSFIPPALAQSGQKGLTEQQAKEKAEKIVAQIGKGADFVKLVKENSDDQTSAQKEGDFGVMRQSDNIPDAIRSAIFTLKPGEITGAVRQGSGFYILKADEVSYRPLSEVRDDLYNQIKDQRGREWMEQTRKSAKVKIVNEKFFTAPAPSPSPAAK